MSLFHLIKNKPAEGSVFYHFFGHCIFDNLEFFLACFVDCCQIVNELFGVSDAGFCVIMEL